MRWQGSGSYKRACRPGHPMADKNGQICVHRLVAAEKLGRILQSNEHVHHINGDRQDNRPENLEVLAQGEHTKRHWAMPPLPGASKRGRPLEKRAFAGAERLVRNLRRSVALTRHDAGSAVGIGEKYLCGVENGRAPLTARLFGRLLVVIENVRVGRKAALPPKAYKVMEEGYGAAVNKAASAEPDSQGLLKFPDST